MNLKGGIMRVQYPKTEKNKAVIAKAINEQRKINPHWISFLHGAIEESKMHGTPVSEIVKREFKGLRKEVSVSPKEEKDTIHFIHAYAQIKFNMELPY
jgi:NADH:ubiquinone oxidoreductase subunit